jgi:DNA-binding SARP family transcriptional activator
MISFPHKATCCRKKGNKRNLDHTGITERIEIDKLLWKADVKQEQMLEIKVLGSVEIVANGKVGRISAPKARCVLALMALHANQVVYIESIIEELWDQNPPKTAVTTVQTYMYHLRRLLAECTDPDGSVSLETRQRGYALVVRDGQIDAMEFLRLIDCASSAFDSGKPAEAARQVHRAFGLWHGPALADVATGPLLEAHLVHLREQRKRALEIRIEADLELGRHRALIPELRYLIAQDSLNEWLHGRLIVALERSGRRSEALQAYQDVRQVLHDEVGLEPSEGLRRIQHEVLTA